MQVQTSALFGDLTQLQSQMQQVVGQDAHSMEELMQRVQVCMLLQHPPKRIHTDRCLHCAFIDKVIPTARTFCAKIVGETSVLFMFMMYGAMHLETSNFSHLL